MMAEFGQEMGSSTISESASGTANLKASAQYSFLETSKASIYSAEAHALALALDIVESSNYTAYYIFSDSMSCLQALYHHKLETADLLQILENVMLFKFKGKLLIFAGYQAMLE